MKNLSRYSLRYGVKSQCSLAILCRQQKFPCSGITAIDLRNFCHAHDRENPYFFWNSSGSHTAAWSPEELMGMDNVHVRDVYELDRFLRYSTLQ